MSEGTGYVTGEHDAGELRRPREHRTPRDATIKQLYGTAFRCGEPSCRKPLYRINDQTGEYILNSRVAHIHARSEGGPRWDANMSEEDNRSANNLIPLCEPHAWEIDATPNHFPADMLHEWKAAQLAEYQELQRSWRLTDDEVAQIREASFSPIAVGAAAAGAAALTAAARAVGMLIATCRHLRNGPESAAVTWRARRAEVNASMPVWDTNGERLTVEPSAQETRQLRNALVAQLTEARDRLQPLAHDVIAELHAVTATRSDLDGWSQWVEDAVVEVVSASSRWPEPGYGEDDVGITAALEQLQRASQALGAAWRGDDAEQPPPPLPIQEPVEDPSHRAAREHRELLEVARPWSRVDHRPFDPALYSALLDATRYAMTLPPVMSTIAFDLRATARLAARVARNADDTVYAHMIDQAAHAEPLCVAVALLTMLGSQAADTGRGQLATIAEAHVTAAVTTAEWSDPQTWETNEMHTGSLLAEAASRTTPDEIAGVLITALAGNANLIPYLLRAMTSWYEQRDSSNIHNLLAVKRHVDQVHAWFPLDHIVEAIRVQLPDVRPAAEDDDEGYVDETRNLAAQALRIHAQRLNRAQ